MSALYKSTHTRILHACGHEHDYRNGHEWPAHRRCFTCCQARAEWILRRIQPHVRGKAHQYAILAIIHELIEQIPNPGETQ